MKDFIVDLFVPDGYDASISAVIANIYVKDHSGALYVNRCTHDNVDNKLKQLNDWISIAGQEGIGNPFHREIWIVGLYPSTNVKAELFDSLVKNHGCSRTFCCQSSVNLLIALLKNDDSWTFKIRPSILYFLSDMIAINEKQNDLAVLYGLLDSNDFEYLVTQMLINRPEKRFVVSEDSILSMFVEHQKRKISEDG